MEFGLGRELDTSDVHVEVVDRLSNRVEAELGVRFFVAAFSSLRKAPATAATLVLGDMSIQGNIKPLRSLRGSLRVAMDNGARRSLEVTSDIVEHVDPVFFGDPKAAAFKALGLT